MEKEFDFIIIGAGISGLAAAMYSARLGMKTLCLGKNNGSELPVGGVITTTNIVENYPGFIRISGEELAKKIEEHARSYDLVQIREEKATDIIRDTSGFFVLTENNKYKAKAILFATGTRLRKLSVKGSKEFEGKGVNYCALCDAPLYKNKIVAVIGGSDTAAKEALILSKYASKVFIIYRGEKIRAEQINIERIKEDKKIEIINNTNLVEIIGKGKVEAVILDREYKGTNELKLNGIFVAIGHEAISELAEKLGVLLNEKKEIIINHKTAETNIKGVFAAGDVTDKPFKQAIIGASEGCLAAFSAFEFIKQNSNIY